MIRRTVRVQLAAFALLTVVLVAVLSANYVGLTDKVLGGSYVVSADLAESGGIFVGAEVTYRGVTVGRVERLRLRGDGVLVDARIDRGVHVPRDTGAVVENRSAVGEQYLDLQPRAAGGPMLAAGAVIPRNRTAVPIRVDTLLTDINATVASVPRDALLTTVDELGRAFRDGGGDLGRLIDAGTELTAAATEALPQTTALIHDGRLVLDTQARTAGQVRTWIGGFADVAQTVRDSDTDVRLVLDRGALAARELTGLVRENKTDLAALLANFITLGNVTTARLGGLEQLLVTYPDVVNGGYTVVPGDGTAHFGLVLNADDPPACESGYEDTSRTDPHHTSDLPPVNTRAHCAATAASGINVRGSQNAPRPRPGHPAGSSAAAGAPGGATPMPVGSAGVTFSAPDSLTARTPGPAGADGPSWAWMMQEAVR